jgi:hypothetical protein
MSAISAAAPKQRLMAKDEREANSPSCGCQDHPAAWIEGLRSRPSRCRRQRCTSSTSSCAIRRRAPVMKTVAERDHSQASSSTSVGAARGARAAGQHPPAGFTDEPFFQVQTTTPLPSTTAPVSCSTSARHRERGPWGCLPEGGALLARAVAVLDIGNRRRSLQAPTVPVSAEDASTDAICASGAHVGGRNLRSLRLELP